MYIHILVAWLAMQMPDPKQKLDIEHFPIVVTQSCTYTFDSPFLSPSKSKYPPPTKNLSTQLSCGTKVNGIGRPWNFAYFRLISISNKGTVMPILCSAAYSRAERLLARRVWADLGSPTAEP
jgi:hypothetical protein